jgi:lysophospholipase L1-like esterase
MRHLFLALTLATLPLASCSNPSPTIAATPVPAPVTPYALYHAYGDSITYGLYLPSASLAYPSLAASAAAVPLSNYAISGSESCDLAFSQIFPNQESPSLAVKGLYSVLIGTNDNYARGGTGPGETIFNLCHLAALAWLGTPIETKILATSASVTATGPNHLNTSGNLNALTTDAAGAAISFAFTRTSPAPLYLWYQIYDGSPGTFTCALDGNLVASLTTATQPAILTQNNNISSLAIFRLPTVPAGAHVFRCTQTSTQPYGMGLVGLGFPPPSGTLQRPRVLAGLLPLQLYGANAANLAAYDNDISANVALLAADGLDLELFNAAKYMTGTPTDMVDSLHPNTLGDQEIAKAFLDVIQ